MAIYHMSVKPVRRAAGRSAVAAAAYRSATLLRDARTDMAHDYRSKGGVLETGIVLPAGVSADWALDREALWNAAEAAERRKDAKTAKEFEVALPEELADAQRRDLAEAFAQALADGYGAAADWAVHAASRAGDQRNVHAHILLTVREVSAEGLGGKIRLERENGWLKRAGLATSHDQVREWRACWADLANDALARAGHDVRIDHRSHADRGLTIQPVRTVGVHATAMSRRGIDVERTDLDAAGRAWNLEALLGRAEDVLQLVSESRSVFGAADIERAAARAVRDPEAVEAVLRAVMESPELVTIAQDARPGSPRRYTTRRTIRTETEMARCAAGLREDRSCAVSADLQAAALEACGRSMEAAGAGSGLAPEQEAAFRHATGPERIAVIAGVAGAGKSTMLSAARDAWERSGRRVLGAALAGKAVDGLQESSGIESRTLSAWAHRWERGEDRLGAGDVLVIDEAGMLSTAQLAPVLREVERRGAKAVLAGDAEQLQAIGAGAPFRAVAERCGVAALSTVRRQRRDWQREASLLFSGHRTREGLELYAGAGGIVWRAHADAAKVSLAAEYARHVRDRPEASRLALAHRRADVADLNRLVRFGLQHIGLLAEDETRIGTAHGERAFAAGDRIAFLENDSRLGVRNGSFGTVEAVAGGELRVRLDGRADPVRIDPSEFRSFDHGYAATIHKAQGATVDRTFVLAGPTMDRHLAYVAMTRHRDDATIFAARETFRDFGGLARRLSRSGLKRNALDTEGFLARRGLAGFLVRIGRGLRRGLEAVLGASALPSLGEAFLTFPEREGPLPVPEAADRAAEAIQRRILAKELARQEAERRRQERERQAAERQRRERERERVRSLDRGFGFEM